jgi:hypothetical protein
MRVRFGGAERRGRAVDLRDCGVTAGGAAAAVRKQSDDRVACQPPGRVHERVGVLHRGMSVSVRAALAAAARSRGATTDCDADLRAVEAELESLAPADVDLSGARERVAETAAAVDRLREVVARASGRVEACRDAGDASDAEAALADATQELAAAETEHHAAQEALARARQQARGARDDRERRLSLEDERDNLRRAARRTLADRWAGRFERALAALPVPGAPAPPSEFASPDWAAACAVARLADCSAPLVVGDDVFERPVRASAALDAPVLLVEV